MDIREVARRSGVSVATVSRALNNRPDVSHSTRERIVAIAAELGYRPNHQARALVRRRSDLVGLIWDTGYLGTRGRHPFLQDLLVGLKMAFADTGRHLLLLSTPESEVDAYARIARQNNLEGVILMGIDEGHPSISALLESEIPCVAIDLPLHGSRASYVTSDNRAGAATAVQHLYGLGHRRIATICGPLDLMPGAERLAGYRYQTARLDLPYREEYVTHGDFFLASGRACMRQLLALPQPPTAVFAAGDEMAIGALDVLADAGIAVPGQLSVVGYDDIEAAALIRPALTTVAQDSRQLAAAAARLLADILDDGRDPTRSRRRSPQGSAADERSRPTPQPLGDGAAGPDRPITQRDDSRTAVPAPQLVANRLVIRSSTGPAPA